MSEIHLPHDHGGDAPLAAIQEKLQKTEAFQKTAALFQQLGDPTRLRIFWLLCHYRACVTNIAALLQMSNPAVSHHLRPLKASGLIVGREVYYKAADTVQAQLLHRMIERVMEIACPSL